MNRLLQSVIMLMAFCSISAFAQFDYTPDTTMILREKFNKPFPTVWKTIKRLITEENCAIESEKQKTIFAFFHLSISANQSGIFKTESYRCNHPAHKQEVIGAT